MPKIVTAGSSSPPPDKPLSKGDRLMVAFRKLAQRASIDEALAHGVPMNVIKGGVARRVGTDVDVNELLQALGNEAAGIVGELGVDATLEALMKSGVVAQFVSHRVGMVLLEDPEFIGRLADVLERRPKPAAYEWPPLSDEQRRALSLLEPIGTVGHGDEREVQREAERQEQRDERAPSGIELLDGPDPRSIDNLGSPIEGCTCTAGFDPTCPTHAPF